MAWVAVLLAAVVAAWVAPSGGATTAVAGPPLVGLAAVVAAVVGAGAGAVPALPGLVAEVLDSPGVVVSAGAEGLADSVMEVAVVSLPDVLTVTLTVAASVDASVPVSAAPVVPAPAVARGVPEAFVA